LVDRKLLSANPCHAYEHPVMFLSHRQYIRFLNGGVTNVAIIAFLPGELAAYVPTLSTDVRIGGEYARKIWEKHRLGHQALGLVQIIINAGWCVKSRPGQLDFFYVDNRWPSKHYVLGVKSAKRGQETWITTLHPTDERDMRRRLKKAKRNGALIRTAIWQ
jgi:hypothetical protein